MSNFASTFLILLGLNIDSKLVFSKTMIAAMVLAVALHIILIVVLASALFIPIPDNVIPESALQVLLLNNNEKLLNQPEPQLGALGLNNQIGLSPDGKDLETNNLLENAPVDETNVTENFSDSAQQQENSSTAAIVDTTPEIVAEPDWFNEIKHQINDENNYSLAATPQLNVQIPVVHSPVVHNKLITSADILANRDQEIEHLTTNMEVKANSYGRRLRRKSVSATTREYRYASYLDAWASKVEQIGNLNYPQAAKLNHLYGNLILHVTIRADGQVEQINLVRSSGYEILDQAAIRIVNLAAPYAPFPPDIAADTDLLDIVRTWQFLRGDKLSWQHR